MINGNLVEKPECFNASPLIVSCYPANRRIAIGSRGRSVAGSSVLRATASYPRCEGGGRARVGEERLSVQHPTWLQLRELQPPAATGILRW